MSDVSLSEYCERLIRSQLLSEAAVQAAIDQARSKRGEEISASEFAEFLVTEDRLSQFQADSLMQGFTRFFLDDFKLVDRIGYGRMAGVYRAVHKRGMPIAVKILPPNRAQNPDILARFQREAHLARMLHHPHVVKTYHLGCVSGLYYIAMELLEGQTLEERLVEKNTLPPAEVIRLAEQVLQALQHVHKKRLVHRDVKPANLMLVPLPESANAGSRQYTVKLLDVGLGRVLFSEDEQDDGPGPDLTKAGELIGTAAYMAPEQHADSHAADIRSDLYSLGCVLYECLLGQPPFTDRNAVQMAVKHATQLPSELVLEGYPRTAELQRWLWKLMAKKKGDRFRTPHDAAKALRALMDDPLEVAPRIEAPKIPLKRMSWEKASTKPPVQWHPAWTYTGVAMGVLCPLLLLIYSMYHPAGIEQSGVIHPAFQSDRHITERTTPSIADQQLPEQTSGIAEHLIPVENHPAQPGAPGLSPRPVVASNIPSRENPEVARPNQSASPTAPTPSASVASTPGSAAPYENDPPEPPRTGPRVRWAAANSEFTVISSPAAPGVAFTLDENAVKMKIVVEVECAPTETVDLRIGLSAKKQKILTPADAVTTRLADGQRSEFQLASNELIDKPTDWSQLRMGLSAAWKSSDGVERQRERLRHLDRRATHAEMSSNSADWAPLDLTEHKRLMADIQQRLVIPIKLPQAGKTTVVIEDGQGHRVRNLISALRMPAGDQALQWDGLDENRALVSAGDYQWRSISHDGIRPEYLFSFANGGSPTHQSWGPNHTMFIAAAANKEFTFFGAPSTEGGHCLVAIDNRGLQVRDFHPMDGGNHFSVALAADDQHLYALHLLPKDWGAHHNYGKATAPNRKAKEIITLVRFDTTTGNHVPWGQDSFTVIGEFDYGADSAAPKRQPGNELGGVAYWNGKLYVSLRLTGAVRVLDATTGKLISDISVPQPGPLCAGNDAVFVLLDKRIMRIDPASNAISELATIPFSTANGMTCDADGDLYLSNATSHQIHVFDRQGNPTRTIGKAGGPYTGTYDAQRFVNPAGMAIGPDGKLWVTEGRGVPRRNAACDRRTGEVLIERFGPQGYGGGGGGIDSADARRWILQGVLWELDFAGKTATPKSILMDEGRAGKPNGGGLHYRFIRDSGRTFVIGMGTLMNLSELLPEGRLRPLAQFGGPHVFYYASGQKYPAAFLEAWRRSKIENQDPARSGKGLMWVDKNGDGDYQVDEFDIAPEAEPFSPDGWGQDQVDLTFRFTAVRNRQPVLVTLTPQGFYPSGAPKYPKLSQAIAQAVPVDFTDVAGDSTIDRSGNMLLLVEPMRSIAPNGKTRWTYPNQWHGVHGSHYAPLPERGVMQGTLFFQGIAPLDELHDVCVINGNHGRFFVMTSDGMYLDEMFGDTRTGSANAEYMIGGECFGGFFTRGEADGQYYLQHGGRVYRIHGFDQIRRDSGNVSVAAKQLAAAQRSQLRQVEPTATPGDAVIPLVTQTPEINQWVNGPSTAEWSGSSIRLAHDGQQLFATWMVMDKTPWINQGKDWKMLFKTGDSVDLQLGSDPQADPNRTEPVPGDIRLLIAPFQGQTIAVLYRHRATRGPKNSEEFKSPWRSERVDDVRILKTLQLKVEEIRPGQEHYRVHAVIPLGELGLGRLGPQPYKADFGVIYSNQEGTENARRSYWSNQVTGLINDVPGEIMLTPKLWGQIRFGVK